jgi:hypothetical protein
VTSIKINKLNVRIDAKDSSMAYEFNTPQEVLKHVSSILHEARSVWPDKISLNLLDAVIDAVEGK